MLAEITTLLAASAAVASASALPKRGQTASITPHDMYSSSIGVMGCHINTNRVAYWPGSVSCNDICVKISYGGRSLNVLKIDTSGGAHDISYDAWNYLAFGKGAHEEPHQGGGINMDWEYRPASECADLLHNGKIPLSAANSMNYVATCVQNEPNSYAAQNYELYNMLDPVCKYGYDETCTLDLNQSNQATCPHQMGSNHTPTGQKVVNIQYGTGAYVDAP